MRKLANLITIFFLILAMVFISTGLYFYRQNSIESKRLYDKLMATDQYGGDVTVDLNALRKHVYSHMNSRIGGENGLKPPIQLSGTYERLYRAEFEKTQGLNSDLYTKGQQECEKKFAGQPHIKIINCTTDYVTANGVKAKPIFIPEDEYKFDFLSPKWTFDTSGILLSFGLVMLAMSIFGVIYRFIA